MHFLTQYLPQRIDFTSHQVSFGTENWRGGLWNFNNWMKLNLLLWTYDICSVYKNFISALQQLFLASVAIFIQTVINLCLLKDYDIYHSFRVHVVSVSILYLTVWYNYIVILLSCDTKINLGPRPVSGQRLSVFTGM